MTLQVTTNSIQVKNGAGQVKFSSGDRMLWLAASQTGSYGMDANAGSNGWFVTPDHGSGDLIIMEIMFTGGTALSSDLYPGLWRTANGTHRLTTIPGSNSQLTSVQQHVLNIGVTNGAVIFNRYYINVAGLITASNISFQFDYRWYRYYAY